MSGPLYRKMTGKAASGTAPVVIVIPPTDHYRTFVLEGKIRKCTSRPLRLGSSGSSTPCGPNCPAAKYQQLPWESGIVQHYPESVPKKPAHDDTEEQEQQVDQRIGNLENTRSDCDAPVKRPTSETLNLKEAKRGRSSVGNPTVLRKPIPTRPSAKKAPKAIHHKNSKILDSYVVLEQLDLPANCKTVRLVQIDKRLKEELDARLVVSTPKGERLVTPVEGSPSKSSNRCAQNFEQRSPAENETGKKVSTSGPSTTVAASAELEERPLVTDSSGADASSSSRSDDRLETGSKDKGVVRKKAVSKPTKVSKATIPAVTLSRASAIRKSLSIAMPKAKPKPPAPKKNVSPDTESPSTTGEDDKRDTSEPISISSESESSRSSIKTSVHQSPSSSGVDKPSTSAGGDSVKEHTVTRLSENNLSSGRVKSGGREPKSVEVEPDFARTSRRVAKRPSHLEDFFTVLPKKEKDKL